MKTVIFILCTAVSVSSVEANLSGSDDFNDNVMDLSKWSVFTGSVLNEINSRLESAGGSGEVLGAWKWEPNSGTYTNDWSVSLDVVNAVDESGLSGQNVNYGFLAWNASPNDNLFSVEFKVGDAAGGANPYRYIETAAEHNNVNVLAHQTSLSADSARLQISFDASAKAFASYYDFGSGMIMMTNYNINSWGLTDSDIFTVAIYSSSNDLSPLSGDVYGDNFVAIPEPGTLGFTATAGAAGILLHRYKKACRYRKWT